MNLYNLIIGKLYSAEMLGFYNKGQQFPSMLVTNINGSIQSVIFPALSAYQDNRQRVKDMVRRSIVTSSFFLFPTMVGLAMVAKPLVVILLTEKWLLCVPFLQISSFTYALWPIHTANLQAISALGRSDVFLKLQIVKNVIGLTILGVTVSHGIYAIALGGVVSGVLSTVINSYPNRKLLNYSYIEQCKDILPSFLLSLVMGVVVYSVQWFGLSAWLTLMMQICVGVLLYVGMALLFKVECFEYLLATVKEIFESRIVLHK